MDFNTHFTSFANCSAYLTSNPWWDLLHNLYMKKRTEPLTTENILKRRTSKNPKSRGVNEMPLKAEDMKY